MAKSCMEGNRLEEDIIVEDKEREDRDRTASGPEAEKALHTSDPPRYREAS